jgi:hypothetical protein
MLVMVRECAEAKSNDGFDQCFAIAFDRLGVRCERADQTLYQSSYETSGARFHILRSELARFDPFCNQSLENFAQSATILQPSGVDFRVDGLGDESVSEPPASYGSTREGSQGIGDTKRSRPSRGCDLCSHIDFSLGGHTENFREKLGLGRKVPVDGSRGHVRYRGYRSDLSIPKPTFRDQVTCRAENPGTLVRQPLLDSPGSPIRHEMNLNS